MLLDPSQGAMSLARALKANNTLTELDLRWNNVGNDGARALRDSLEANRSLSCLKLSGNKVMINDTIACVGKSSTSL